MNRKHLLLAIAGALAIPFSPLTAQQSAESENMLEEITVTATKRASTIQDLPFSINAMSEEDIRRTGAQNIEELSRYVAGLTIQ